eukprot:15556595-Heterocapsa_arctica.AAC.1
MEHIHIQEARNYNKRKFKKRSISATRTHTGNKKHISYQNTYWEALKSTKVRTKDTDMVKDKVNGIHADSRGNEHNKLSKHCGMKTGKHEGQNNKKEQVDRDQDCRGYYEGLVGKGDYYLYTNRSCLAQKRTE